MSLPSASRSTARRRAAWLVCFCALCWSVAGVFTRRLGPVGGFEITFWRSLFCAAGVAGALGWRAPGGAVRRVVAMGAPGLVSGAMWAVMFTCFMLALTRTSTANTLLVCSLSPLAAALIGRVVLREPVRAGTWAAIAVALAGIAWMVHDGVSAEGVSGMLIALAVPLAAGTNYVTLKKRHATVDLAPAVLIGALLSCAATLPLAWPFAATPRDLAILSLLGLVQLALPCVLVVRAARHLAPHEIALLGLLEVVLGPVWAWLGAGEAMGRTTIEGGLIVLAALAGNEWLGRRLAGSGALA